MRTHPSSRSKVHVLLSCLLLLLVTAPAAGGAERDQVHVAGTDDRYDWGVNWTPGLQKVGELLGQDLLAAEIRPTADHLFFEFQVSLLLSQYAGIGGWPDVSRYLWEMTVNGRMIAIDGLFRPTAACAGGPCTTSPFTVKADCKPTPDQLVVECNRLGSAVATFSLGPPGKISVAVPRTLIGANRDVVIGPVLTAFTEYIGGNVVALPATASYSDAFYPADYMSTRTVRIARPAKPRPSSARRG